MTLVTLAIGRSPSASRLHSTWPVAASARIAPLALTRAGAPPSWSTGPAGRDGVALGLGVAGGWLKGAAAAGLEARPGTAADVTEHADVPLDNAVTAAARTAIRTRSPMGSP